MVLLRSHIHVSYLTEHQISDESPPPRFAAGGEGDAASGGHHHPVGLGTPGPAPPDAGPRFAGAHARLPPAGPAGWLRRLLRVRPREAPPPPLARDGPMRHRLRPPPTPARTGCAHGPPPGHLPSP